MTDTTDSLNFSSLKIGDRIDGTLKNSTAFAGIIAEIIENSKTIKLTELGKTTTFTIQTDDIKDLYIFTPQGKINAFRYKELYVPNPPRRT